FGSACQILGSPDGVDAYVVNGWRSRLLETSVTLRPMPSSLIESTTAEPRSDTVVLPVLPPEPDFDFKSASDAAAGNEKLKYSINNAVLRQHTARQLRVLERPDADQLRTLAGQIKQHTLDNLDYYLEQLIANVRKNRG